MMRPNKIKEHSEHERKIDLMKIPNKNIRKQAGAEIGHAQPQLG